MLFVSVIKSIFFDKKALISLLNNENQKKILRDNLKRVVTSSLRENSCQFIKCVKAN